MQPDHRFRFHISVIGKGNGKTIVVTRHAIDVKLLKNTRCIVRLSALARLTAWLSAKAGNKLAEMWDVDESVLWRMRRSLELAEKYSGRSATTLWRKTGSTAGAANPASSPVTEGEAVPSDLPDITVAFAGDNPARRYLLFDMPPLEMATRGNILVQPAAREQFAMWLRNNTVAEAAKKLSIGRRTVMDARHFCGIRGRG